MHGRGVQLCGCFSRAPQLQGFLIGLSVECQAAEHPWSLAALANICRVTRVLHAAVPSITKPQDVPPARLCPELAGTHGSPPRPLAGLLSAHPARWTPQPPPESQSRPCSSGFSQEMAPLQHPTARSPLQDGGEPAPGVCGLPLACHRRKAGHSR